VTRFFERPPDVVTPEEWRLFVDATCGFLRIGQARGRPFRLAVDTPVEIVKNGSKQNLYVRVQGVVVPAAAIIVLGPSSSLNLAASVGARNFNVASTFDQIVMPGESLWVMSDSAITVSVFQITP
jgi:hypothetical protein